MENPSKPDGTVVECLVEYLTHPDHSRVYHMPLESLEQANPHLAYLLRPAHIVRLRIDCEVPGETYSVVYTFEPGEEVHDS